MSDDDETGEQSDHGSGGASIKQQMRDPRMSKALGWFWGMVGAGIGAGIWLAAHNLYELNVTVARGLDADISRDVQLRDHEDRLRKVERSVSTIEGKVFRGVDGYEVQPDGK